MIEQLSKNEIRGIFMRNGFTVKEGCDDLKDYVYAAAYDLLKAQEERHRTIEARLSSIEKLLSAESKPDKHEPEWRPMSEAPRDGRDIKIIANGYEDEMTAWFYVKYKHWVVESGRYPLYMVESCIKGWRPL